MEHDWEIVITEYYEMDADWVCKSCGKRIPREHLRGSGGSFLDEKESLEQFKTRIFSDKSWYKVPVKCPGKVYC